MGTNICMQQPILPCDRQRVPAVLDETEESGWKNIHGEVFRFPPNKNLFCAFVGSGFQVSSQLPPYLSW